MGQRVVDAVRFQRVFLVQLMLLEDKGCFNLKIVCDGRLCVDVFVLGHFYDEFYGVLSLLTYLLLVNIPNLLIDLDQLGQESLLVSIALAEQKHLFDLDLPIPSPNNRNRLE